MVLHVGVFAMITLVAAAFTTGRSARYARVAQLSSAQLSQRE
jgi:hypothetical protein